MYSQRFTFVPVYGKQAEVRQAVEERARAFQAGGIRAGAFVSVASDHLGAAYGTIQFDTLADLQANREHPAEDQVKATQKMTGSLQGLVSESSMGIYEILMPLTPTGSRRYIQLVTRTPLPGKNYALQELSLEIANLRQSEGINAGVQVQFAGPNAGDVDLLISFSDLEELGKLRAGLRSNAQFREMQERAAALMAGPASIRIVESTVPLPARS